MTEVRISSGYGPNGLSLQDYETRYTFTDAGDNPPPPSVGGVVDQTGTQPEPTIAVADAEIFLVDLMRAIDEVSTALIRQRSLIVNGGKGRDRTEVGVAVGIQAERAAIKHTSGRKSSMGRLLFSEEPVFLATSSSGRTYVRLVTGSVEQRWPLNAASKDLLRNIDRDLTVVYSMRSRAEVALRAVRLAAPSPELSIMLSTVVSSISAQREALGATEPPATFRPVKTNPFNTMGHYPGDESWSEGV